jgi:hypothetical protein
MTKLLANHSNNTGFFTKIYLLVHAALKGLYHSHCWWITG